MNKDISRQSLKDIVEKMLCVVSDIVVTEKDSVVVFSIHTPHGDTLIGPQGETLSSITHLFRKILEKKNPEVSTRTVSVDVNGYREERALTLRGIAQMLADRARTFKHDVEMDPLPSYDRLIIHSFFEHHPWITTESTGFGKSRRVILKYKERDPALLKAEF